MERSNEATAIETSPVGSPFENIEDPYNVGPPSDVCWFINPINYSYKYHKP